MLLQANWDYGTVGGVTAGVSVRGVFWTDAEMQEIDTAIDDGNLNSGNFRKINSDFTYVIE